MSEQQQPEPGQVWARKRDDRRVQVVSVDRTWNDVKVENLSNRRRSMIFADNLRRMYALTAPAPVGAEGPTGEGAGRE